MLVNLELSSALVEDLQQIIRLHDQEIDQQIWLDLQAVNFPLNLALQAVTQSEVAQLTNQAVINNSFTPQFADLLAADFAAIYLTASHGCSPYESVWLSDDHLTAQQPMFEWKEIFQREKLQFPAEKLYADHLVLQLNWLLLKLQEQNTNWHEQLAIIDQHHMFWLQDWVTRVMKTCDQQFYAGLAGLTWEWLCNFRHILSDLTGVELADREKISALIKAKMKKEGESVATIKFMPGRDGPSW